MYHIFDSLESTNKYCELLDLDEVEEFAVVCAREQTAGIGQRGNHWESEPGLNLTFSIVLHPRFLAAAKQFGLTQALSLGVCDWLRLHLATIAAEPLIKWPNDIYVDGRKICGMLTSVHLSGDRVASAVCGIGLNINQTRFPDWIPNPVSLVMLTGHSLPLREALEGLTECIQRRYEQLRTDATTIDACYHGLLYRRGLPTLFLHHGRTLRATIEGVNAYGHLQLLSDDGTHLSCQLKELQFLPHTQQPTME